MILILGTISDGGSRVSITPGYPGISWNFIDAAGKCNCQLKYANLVTSLNPRKFSRPFFVQLLIIGGLINVKILLEQFSGHI